MRYFLLSFGCLLVIELCMLAWLVFHASMGTHEPEDMAAMTPLCCSCMVSVDQNLDKGGRHVV
jgi:hypothetical protein